MNAEPARATNASLPPQANAAVRAAQDALEQEAARAETVGDPVAPVLRALSQTVGGIHQVAIEGSLTIGRQIEAARQPISNEDLNRLAESLSRDTWHHALCLARAANWRTLTIAAGVLVVVAMVCTGAGYWQGHRDGLTKVPPFNSMMPADAAVWSRIIADNPGVGAAALKVCEAQARPNSDGRRGCPLGVWIDPPVPSVPKTN